MEIVRVVAFIFFAAINFSAYKQENRTLWKYAHLSMGWFCVGYVIFASLNMLGEGI